MPDGDLFGCSLIEAGRGCLEMSDIQGLSYRPDFLTAEEAVRVADRIDAGSWQDDLSRRVQHFGYRYDYKSRGIDESMRADPLPEWAVRIGNRLVKQGFFTSVPDQVIVNEYQPGQGIAQHVDCVPCFKDVLVSLSLMSPCLMTFDRRSVPGTVDLDLAPGSLVVLTGDARYLWRHGIMPRRSDPIDGGRRLRRRRVSLTFRSVLLGSSRAKAAVATPR